MLSCEESLAAMVETTAVQSLQVSAVARARRAEVKMNAFMVEVNIISYHHFTINMSSRRGRIPSLWRIERRQGVDENM